MQSVCQGARPGLKPRASSRAARSFDGRVVAAPSANACSTAAAASKCVGTTGVTLTNRRSHRAHGIVANAAPRRPEETASPMADDEIYFDPADFEDEDDEPVSFALDSADDDDDAADDDEDVVNTEEVSEETLRIMEHTRGLRLDRFADAHDAATRRAAERRVAKAKAKAGARADKAELKRAASAVPLAPRDGTLRHPSTAPPPPGGGGGGGEGDYAFHHETVRDDEEQWRMLRLRTGETVYFGAPDTLPETVAAWLDGTKPWPEIRAMELSIAARRALSVPPGAPGPVVCEALAEAAKAELRMVAEEDAAAAAAALWSWSIACASLAVVATASPSSRAFFWRLASIRFSLCRSRRRFRQSEQHARPGEKNFLSLERLQLKQ
mmetsp:Transcript_2213/g.8576  ORF Transcript_2213/g.8576 Transcript_2213/m.8576 type:complete len:382 (-) Transcript_2213:112-1257(-)